MPNSNLTSEGTPERSEVTAETPMAQASTDSVPAALQAVFDLNTIPDVTNRHIVEQALLYIQNPTELSELSRHRSDVSTVSTDYEMCGEDVPSAIDNLHRDLIEAECRMHMQTAESLFSQEVPSSSLAAAEIHVLRALDNARVLAKGYGRPALLPEVEALQQRLAALKQ